MVSIVQALINFLGLWLGSLSVDALYKIGIVSLFITLLTAAISAYTTLYVSAINGISVTVPDIVSGVWGWVMPSNVPVLLLAIVTAKTTTFLQTVYLKIFFYKFDKLTDKPLLPSPIRTNL